MCADAADCAAADAVHAHSLDHCGAAAASCSSQQRLRSTTAHGGCSSRCGVLWSVLQLTQPPAQHCVLSLDWGLAYNSVDLAASSLPLRKTTRTPGAEGNPSLMTTRVPLPPSFEALLLCLPACTLSCLTDCLACLLSICEFYVPARLLTSYVPACLCTYTCAGPGMMGGGMGMPSGSMAPGGLMGAGGSGPMGMMQVSAPCFFL